MNTDLSDRAAEQADHNDRNAQCSLRREFPENTFLEEERTTQAARVRAARICGQERKGFTGGADECFLER